MDKPLYEGPQIPSVMADMAVVEVVGRELTVMAGGQVPEAKDEL